MALLNHVREAKADKMDRSNECGRSRRKKKKTSSELLEELWNSKEYGHLNLKSQNLRDQASRLEKLPRNAKKSSESNNGTTNVPQNTNFLTFYSNLHTFSTL